MIREKKKVAARCRRRRRIRKKISGTAERPRLSVFRSNRHIFAQFIDDDSGKVLGAFSTTAGSFREHFPGPTGNIAASERLGELAGEAAKKLNVRSVVFDRGGYRYHGRVKALAEAVRKAGIEF